MVSLSCAVSQSEAADLVAVTVVVCRRGTYVIPAAGIIAVALDRFGRDRGHVVTCNRLFPNTIETKMIEIGAQSYVGKSPILKGIGELYGGLGCVFRGTSCGAANRHGFTRHARPRWDKRHGGVLGTGSIAFAEPVIELPMILQNALIFGSKRPGTLCK
jgi:hypothetical protein